MSYEFFIAKRYFHSKRRTGFISLINYFSIAGVMIGVAALIIALSIMNGFETEIRSAIIGFDADIRFRSFHDNGMEYSDTILNTLKKFEHVAGVSPYIFNKGLIISRDNLDGILIKASDPETINSVSNFNHYIVEGEFNFNKVHLKNDSIAHPGIILGRSLASRLEINLKDKIFIASFPNNDYLSGPRQLLLKAYYVTGIFETGLYDYDNNFGYLSIESAQELFKLGNRISGMEIKLDQIDVNLIKVVAEKISNVFGYPFMAESWFERNRNIFAWMKMQKWVAAIVIGLIIIVAAFNIISNLIMVVMEKKREIGILKSIGSRSKSVLKIFVFQGLISGLIGTVLGCAVGYILCWSQLHYRWFSLKADVYFMSSLPVEMRALDFILIATVGIVLSLLATIYPSWKAANLDPVQAISLIE